MSTRYTTVPRWTHNCDGCQYLGTVDIIQKYDVYICRKCDGGTFLARYDDAATNPGGYASQMIELFEQVILDQHRAMVMTATIRGSGSNYITQDLEPWRQAVYIALLYHTLRS